jgi:AcrR family transcriptional regulator
VRGRGASVLTDTEAEVADSDHNPAAPTRARRARGSINPADILAGAFDFCRQTPVEDLTMPRLAAHLSVGVTSIYWYFKSKRDLLEAMTEQALSSFYADLPALREEAWEAQVRGFFISFHDLLAADELKCDLIIRRIGTTADSRTIHSWPRAEQLLERLVAAGFSASVARHAFVTLSIYTQGCLLVERTSRTLGPRTSPGPEDIDLEFGLDSIIRGLQLIRAEPPDHRGPVDAP